MSKRPRSTSPSAPPSLRTSLSPSHSTPSTPTSSSSKIHIPSDTTTTTSTKAQNTVIRCTLPPHPAIPFTSYDDYEVHYLQAHVNRCSTCGKNFPTAHFLDLHIEENHDSVFEARRARGEKMYGCFIEGCEKKCSTPKKRRLHLIDKHMFPRTYNFYIINDGIDKQSSMLQPTHSNRHRHNHRHRPIPPTESGEGRLRHRETPEADSKTVSDSVSNQDVVSQRAASETEMEIDELEKSMSALRFVPPSVTKSKGRLGRKS